MEELYSKINNGTAKIGIIGLGYVGLPLAMVFAKRYNVFGHDLDNEVIETLNQGISHIKDVKSSILKKYLNETFYPTNDHKELKKCDFLILCVPTPLTIDKEPDLSHIKNACEMILNLLIKNHFVILESTTFPGTTEEVVVTILEKSRLKAGIDFGIAYSPERIDPGSEKYTIENTPKIVAGINQKCTEIAAHLYESVINAEIIKVKDCRTAEAIKITENIFREVNIALVNELALIFEKMEINVWDVINAASTKPFGYMPFYPGPGVGGHCIPLDPYYLSYKAKKFGIIPKFIELSGEINEYMKVHTVNLVAEGLKKVDKKIFGSNVSILGLAYKKDIDDTRESPAKKIIEELLNLGGSVKVYDPYAKSIITRYGEFFSEDSIENAIKDSDCIIFVTDHTYFKKIDLEMIEKLMSTPVIIDCRNIIKNVKDDIVYYGIGKRE